MQLEHDQSDQLSFEINELSLISNARQRARFSAGAFLASYSNKRTRDGYATDLRTFFAFLDRFMPDLDPIHDVRRPQVDLYARWLEEQGRAPSTVARRIAVVGQWYHYLRSEEVIERNPTEFVKRPKVPRESTREWLTRREMQLQLELAEHEAKTDPARWANAYALLCLLCTNALRIAEVCTADVDDLSKVRYHETLRIVGKGNKPTRVALPARTAEAVHTAVGDRTEGPLILNRYGLRMNREGAGRICDHYARAAGISRRITPHSWRHGAITAFAKANNGNVIATQRFARHADVTTTMRYVRDGETLDTSGSYVLSNYVAGAD